MTDFDSISIKDLLPKILRDDADIAAVADVVSADLRRINASAKLINIVKTLSQQPDSVLSVLAYQRHVEGYSESLLRASRESLIHNSIVLHRLKGTPDVIYRAVAALGLDVTVEEWQDYGGEPYHFRLAIDLYGQDYPQETSDMVDLMIAQYKNVRSVLDGITINYAVNGPEYQAVGLYTSEIITVHP